MGLSSSITTHTSSTKLSDVVLNLILLRYNEKTFGL